MGFGMILDRYEIVPNDLDDEKSLSKEHLLDKAKNKTAFFELVNSMEDYRCLNILYGSTTNELPNRCARTAWKNLLRRF